MESNREKARELWQRFLVLSEEMEKFLKRDEVDMFLSLLGQRGVLQKEIERLDDAGFTRSPEGRELGEKIIKISANLQYLTQVWLNRSKQNRNMARAYENLGYGQNLGGFRLNKNY